MTLASARAHKVVDALAADSNAFRRTPPAPHAVLSLRNASVHARASGQQLLHIPQLDLFPGQRIVITGPSGSGKSLLLSTLAGRWDSGLEFSGSRRANLTQIGFIPQRGLDALHPLYPVGRQLRSVTAATAQQLGAAFAAVGLHDPELQRRRPTELSGGQAQRVAIALATLTRAPLILADEPTSALDPVSRDRTLQLLRSVVTPTQALVVVTHDPAVATALATRQLALLAGTVTELPMPAGASDTAPGARR